MGDIMIPGRRSLLKYPGRVSAWILKENQLPALYQNSIIPNCILSIYPLPTGKFSFHSSSKLLLAADRDCTGNTSGQNAENNWSWGSRLQWVTTAQLTHLRLWKSQRARGCLLWSCVFYKWQGRHTPDTAAIRLCKRLNDNTSRQANVTKRHT